MTSSHMRTKIKREEPVVDTPSTVPDALVTPIKTKIPLPVPRASQLAHHPAAITTLVLGTDFYSQTWKASKREDSYRGKTT